MAHRGARILVITVGVAVIILLGVLSGNSLSGIIGRMSGVPLAWVSQRSEQAASFVRAVWRGRGLPARVSDLEQQNRLLRSQNEALEDVQRENDELRAAVGLEGVHREHKIAARLFVITKIGNGFAASMNRGAGDGVTVGDTVTTTDGRLVGDVGSVTQRSASVIVVSDPRTEITVRTSDGTTGLARGLGTDGLSMELISKDDVLTEGATVMTSGNDTYPAGLAVGTVRYVDSDSATLFKTVRITPAIDSAFDGMVFIVGQ